MQKAFVGDELIFIVLIQETSRKVYKVLMGQLKVFD